MCFDGQLFDPIVFDDSVKEFLRLKKKRADYFDEDTKDIKHNFKQLDALPYAKDGTLGDVLDELYPEQQ